MAAADELARFRDMMHGADVWRRATPLPPPALVPFTVSMRSACALGWLYHHQRLTVLGAPVDACDADDDGGGGGASLCRVGARWGKESERVRSWRMCPVVVCAAAAQPPLRRSDPRLVGVKLCRAADPSTTAERELMLMLRGAARDLVGVPHLRCWLAPPSDDPRRYEFAVYDYYAGGDLRAWRHRVHATTRGDAARIERAVLAVTRPVAVALAYLHSMRIAHMDVKPANVALTWDARPVLIDFGLACVIDTAAADTTQPRHRTMCRGTPLFMAPELLRGVEPPATMDARLCDAWSFGAMLMELVTADRRTPYGHLGDALLSRSHKRHAAMLPALDAPRVTRMRCAHGAPSASFQDLVCHRLVVVDVTRRWSLSHALLAPHDWFASPRQRQSSQRRRRMSL